MKHMELENVGKGIIVVVVLGKSCRELKISIGKENCKFIGIYREQVRKTHFLLENWSHATAFVLVIGIFNMISQFLIYYISYLRIWGEICGHALLLCNYVRAVWFSCNIGFLVHTIKNMDIVEWWRSLAIEPEIILFLKG